MAKDLERMRRCFQPRQWFVHEGEPDPFSMEEEEVLMWVYRKEDGASFVVGYYTPHGEWFAESTFTTADEAAARVNYLNGGKR